MLMVLFLQSSNQNKDCATMAKFAISYETINEIKAIECPFLKFQIYKGIYFQWWKNLKRIKNWILTIYSCM